MLAKAHMIAFKSALIIVTFVSVATTAPHLAFVTEFELLSLNCKLSTTHR